MIYHLNGNSQQKAAENRTEPVKAPENAKPAAAEAPKAEVKKEADKKAPAKAEKSGK